MTLIDKAEALLPCPFCGEVPEIKERGESIALFVCSAAPCKGSSMFMGFVREDREKAIASWNRRAALPARGVEVPEIDGWVRRLRKTEEAGHVHHLSKADRLAIADFLAALAPTDAAHVNETPKSEHDAGNVLTDAALIARLREIQGQAGLFASAAADRIDALMLARAEAAQEREAALKKAAQLAYEVWDDPEALAKAILALIGETRT